MMEGLGDIVVSIPSLRFPHRDLDFFHSSGLDLDYNTCDICHSLATLDVKG